MVRITGHAMVRSQTSDGNSGGSVRVKGIWVAFIRVGPDLDGERVVIAQEIGVLAGVADGVGIVAAQAFDTFGRNDGARSRQIGVKGRLRPGRRIMRNDGEKLDKMRVDFGAGKWHGIRAGAVVQRVETGHPGNPVAGVDVGIFAHPFQFARQRFGRAGSKRGKEVAAFAPAPLAVILRPQQPGFVGRLEDARDVFVRHCARGTRDKDA